MADNSRRYRPYRLGLDVGSNSLGWFVVWLNDRGEAIDLGPGGVRIYPDGRDPKSKESNAAERRTARGARRRRDRYRKRRSNLMSLVHTCSNTACDSKRQRWKKATSGKTRL